MGEKLYLLGLITLLSSLIIVGGSLTSFSSSDSPVISNVVVDAGFTYYWENHAYSGDLNSIFPLRFLSPAPPRPLSPESTRYLSPYSSRILSSSPLRPLSEFSPRTLSSLTLRPLSTVVTRPLSPSTKRELSTESTRPLSPSPQLTPHLPKKTIIQPLKRELSSSNTLTLSPSPLRPF